MRIGELASRTGVSRDTVRFYERERLISSVPSASGSNRYRSYDEQAVLRIRYIKEAQELGFSLAHIRKWLDNYLDGNLPPDQAVQLMQEHLRYLDERIARLQQMRTSTAELLQAKQANQATQAGQVPAAPAPGIVGAYAAEVARPDPA